jgi:anti-anti-sigma regulatory factor
MQDMILVVNQTSHDKWPNNGKNELAARIRQQTMDLRAVTRCGLSKTDNGDSMNDIIIENRGNAKVLHLSGELVIQHANRLRSGFIESLRDANRIEIDLSAATDVDISFLQLLCSAHKSAIHAGKSVALDYSRSTVVTETIQRAGYFRHTGCMGNEKCFWSEVSHG